MRSYSLKQILCLLVILFTFSDIYSSDAESRLIPVLRNIKEKGIVYNYPFASDSILNQTIRLVNSLERKKEYDLYFEFKSMLIDIYASKGDITLATERGKEMHRKAVELNHKKGMAMACESIGDVYLQAGMSEEGSRFLQEAAIKLSDCADSYDIRRNIYFKLMMQAIRTNNVEDASTYFQIAQSLPHKDNNENYLTNDDFNNAFYYLFMEEPQQAKPFIDRIESRNIHNDKVIIGSRLFRLHAKYFEAMGDYPEALSYYDRMVKIQDKLSVQEYTLLYSDLAALYIKMDQPEKACMCYRFMKEKKDEDTPMSYLRQINTFRTIYQIDQLKLESKAKQNRNLFYSIIALAILIFVIFGLSVLLKMNSRKLILNKRKLYIENEKVEDSIRAKSLFLSNMSHEIRTPLNALVGFSSLLTDEKMDGETKKQCVDLIKTNSSLLIKLINDVIDLSNFNIGNMDFNIVRCDAIQLCKDVLETLDKIKQTDASLHFETDFASLYIETDVNRLQQVLINLLVNSTKFTKNGTITLALKEAPDRQVRFVITDTGCGVPSEKQDYIFTRFEKLHENEQGAGLGLSICQLIVERLGGKIWIDKDYTDGARFIFSHPMKQTVTA